MSQGLRAEASPAHHYLAQPCAVTVIVPYPFSFTPILIPLFLLSYISLILDKAGHVQPDSSPLVLPVESCPTMTQFTLYPGGYVFHIQHMTRSDSSDSSFISQHRLVLLVMTHSPSALAAAYVLTRPNWPSYFVLLPISLLVCASVSYYKPL